MFEALSENAAPSFMFNLKLSHSSRWGSRLSGLKSLKAVGQPKGFAAGSANRRGIYQLLKGPSHTGGPLGCETHGFPTKTLNLGVIPGSPMARMDCPGSQFEQCLQRIEGLPPVQGKHLAFMKPIKVVKVYLQGDIHRKCFPYCEH